MPADRADPRHPGFQGDSIYKKKLIERYEFCNQFVQDKVVLDVPTSLGWGASMLSGYKYLIGYDVSEDAIQFARENYGGDDIRFYVVNMTQLPASMYDFFDVVICLEGYEHINRLQQLLFVDEVNKVLRKGGLFIVTTPIYNKNNKKNPFHLHEPTEEEFLTSVEKYFKTKRFDLAQGGDGQIIRWVGVCK